VNTETAQESAGSTFGLRRCENKTFLLRGVVGDPKGTAGRWCGNGKAKAKPNKSAEDEARVWPGCNGGRKVTQGSATESPAIRPSAFW
jgi:hypothetical protein